MQTLDTWTCAAVSNDNDDKYAASIPWYICYTTGKRDVLFFDLLVAIIFTMLGLGLLTDSAILDLGFILTLSWALWTVQTYRRLSHIPGPRSWGISVFSLFRLHQQGDIYHKLGQLCEEYGPLVRIAPNTVLTSEARTPMSCVA